MVHITTAAWKDDEGAMAIEYAILASAIAVVIAATVRLVGEKLPTIFGSLFGAWP